MIELDSLTAILIAFFAGSIPFGVLVGKCFGVSNLRNVGSGNTGATNVVRAAGWKAGAITFILDGLKSYLPMLLIQCTADQCGEKSVWIGFIAVIGHCYSPFLKFNGGKGVSTAFGVLFALNPIIGALSGLAYGLTLAATKTSALGSLIAMLTAVASTFYFSDIVNTRVAVIAMVFIILYRHKKNWQELFSKIKKTDKKKLMAVALFLSTDFSGTAINYNTKHEKIVTLMPSIAEIAIELGAKDKIIAAPEFTRIPDDVKKKLKS